MFIEVTDQLRWPANPLTVAVHCAKKPFNYEDFDNLNTDRWKPGARHSVPISGKE